MSILSEALKLAASTGVTIFIVDTVTKAVLPIDGLATKGLAA